MGLGEAEVREGGESPVDGVRRLGGDAALGHPRVQSVAQPCHAGRRAFGRHGLAQFVRLRRGESGDGDSHLHQLLLEKRDPERAPQDGLEEGVQIGDRLEAAATTDVGVDGVALDGPGPDERHLDHQVVEAAGPDPGQGPHLGPALDLEDPDGVGRAQQVVDLGLLWQRTEIEGHPVVVSYQVDGPVQRFEHAQPEEIELHQSNGRAIVLVPLQHGAPGHAPPFHRTDLHHRAVTDHHPRRVDAEVAGAIEDLGGQFDHEGRDGPGRPVGCDRAVGCDRTVVSRAVGDRRGAEGALFMAALASVDIRGPDAHLLH